MEFPLAGNKAAALEIQETPGGHPPSKALRLAAIGK